MVATCLRRRLLPAALLLGLGLAGPARAGDLIRLFGDENAGTASAQFLRIPVGARAVGLGQAYAAVATDGAAIFWNPAGLIRTPGRQNWFAGHVAWAADIDLEYAAFHRRGQNFAQGLMFGTLRSGDILRTDELHQEGTGQYFNANQFFVGGSLARAMTDRFSIGMTVKFFQENLDQYQTRALLADMGILYYVGVGDLRVGFSVRNFGSDVKPSGTPPPAPDGYVATWEFQSFPAPTVGAFGVAKTWDLSSRVTVLTTADFNHPSDYSESFRLGGELGLRRQFFLRAGYETNRDEGGFAAGFGLQVERHQLRIRVDYAYGDMGSFGGVHHFSIDLSPLWRSPVASDTAEVRR
ncbi:MAG: PorV/PorQ family protein [bacterium]|nr:PorV/PorQ family protein [bacterium]